MNSLDAIILKNVTDEKTMEDCLKKIESICLKACNQKPFVYTDRRGKEYIENNNSYNFELTNAVVKDFEAKVLLLEKREYGIALLIKGNGLKELNDLTKLIHYMSQKEFEEENETFAQEYKNRVVELYTKLKDRLQDFSCHSTSDEVKESCHLYCCRVIKLLKFAMAGIYKKELEKYGKDINPKIKLLTNEMIKASYALDVMDCDVFFLNGIIKDTIDSLKNNETRKLFI